MTIKMTDHELQVAAAQAAGYTLTAMCGADGEIHVAEKQGPWRPLVDDGDAMRLAKARFLSVDFNNGIVRSPIGTILAVSEIDINRAIVRAAVLSADED